MKAQRVVLAVLVVSLALTARADDEREIRKLDHENTVATWTADSRWFDQNLADDFVQITANGIVKTKIDIVRDLNQTDFAMEPYEPTEVQVRVYGDTAIVTGRVLQIFTRNGSHYVVDARYTDVYARRKGHWILVSAHASPVMKQRR